MEHSWQDFALAAPELAAFGAERFAHGPAYLATVLADGSPRLRPVTPIIGEGHLLLFMEPTSPKGRDRQCGSAYALHCSVDSTAGGAGEFLLTGHAALNSPRSGRVRRAERAARCARSPVSRGCASSGPATRCAA